MMYCKYEGVHSLRGSSTIKNHIVYGTNASPTICFICKKPIFYTPFFNTVNIDCRNNITTFPYMVCPKCKDMLEYATLFIETIEKEDSVEFGNYIFIVDEALSNYFDDVDKLDKINYMHPQDYALLKNDINIDIKSFEK